MVSENWFPSMTFEEALKKHSWEERKAQLERRKIKFEVIDVREWIKQYDNVTI